MIRLLKHGDYHLIETRGATRILELSGKGNYVWVNASGIGEILVFSQGQYQTSFILAQGKYRIYEVKDEDKLTDTIHLELFIGDGIWQGYLLITGLPTGGHKRSRILPTKEIITKSNVSGFRSQTAHPQASLSPL